MKEYKHWIISCICISTVCLLVISTGYYFFVTKPIYNFSNLKIGNTVDQLIIGASHSACAFDIGQFEHTAIVARSGEPIFFTYYKLKELIKENTKINQIIWTLSENSISVYQDYRVTMKKEGARDTYFTYFFFLDNGGRDYLNVLSGNYILSKLRFDYGMPLSYSRDLKLIMKYYLRKKLNYFDFDFAGGAEGNIADTHLSEDLIQNKIETYFGHGQLSYLAVEHIKKIIRLCVDNKIKLEIVNVPRHNKFISQTPEFFKKKYAEFMRSILKEYSSISYFDYSEFSMPDTHYLDGDHLNKYGKKVFTQCFLKDRSSKIVFKTGHQFP